MSAPVQSPLRATNTSQQLLRHMTCGRCYPVAMGLGSSIKSLCGLRLRLKGVLGGPALADCVVCRDLNLFGCEECRDV